MKNVCRSCGFGGLVETLDLGPQPLSNRFLTSPEEPSELWPMRFGYCSCCGLAQLLSPRPSESVRSQHAWLSYNEPEGHLDQLVEFLWNSSLAGNNTRVCGVTYKDDSTLARFRRKGILGGLRLDQNKDLEIHEPLAGLETIQAKLTPAAAKEIAANHGSSNILIVRHLLEHAQNPLGLLHACQELTEPGGLMAFEVPDCRKMLEGGDHCFLWEEHITYFTPASLEGFFSGAGFTDVDIQIYPYAMEDSLVAVVRNLAAPAGARVLVPGEVERIVNFSNCLKERGERIRGHLEALRRRGGKIALFGAGHLTLKFINYYNLAPYLSFIADDNPNKQGLFMPGSGLPIVGSDWLEKDEVRLCLLGLNPESEHKVLQAKRDYLLRGGRFISVFSASKQSIDGEL